MVLPSVVPNFPEFGVTWSQQDADVMMLPICTTVGIRLAVWFLLGLVRFGDRNENDSLALG